MRIWAVVYLLFLQKQIKGIIIINKKKAVINTHIHTQKKTKKES